MTLEALPRGATAMLVVELQNDLAHPSLAAQKGLSGKLAAAVAERGILPRLAGLLDACRAAGVPVLYATKERHPALPVPPTPRIYKAAGAAPKLVTGTWGAQVLDEIAPRDGDIVLARFTSLDPSHGSEMWNVLRNLGATTLVVAGISTTLAVEGVVRAAANRSIRAVVVEDCCASFPMDWHRFSMENILPLIADVASAAEVQAAL